jgi:hypothetical protein
MKVSVFVRIVMGVRILLVTCTMQAEKHHRKLPVKCWRSSTCLSVGVVERFLLGKNGSVRRVREGK